ncbi:energy transducer TonB [Gimibacter soli]|uniref:Energy transducer TonB n=1 Tax=Gimibacter soli TaxID=3024400 RepID=A0AAE9XUS0_9PROT|nr:energy transducer TonB [Gimibacter soli]WCL54980.1 energy transducer TonB [Gimibacter soli]
MTVARLSSSMIGASAVTFGLAFLMQGLVVFRDDLGLNDSPARPMPRILEDIDETEPVKTDWSVKIPQQLVPPKIEPEPIPGVPNDPTKVGISPPHVPSATEDLGPTLSGLADGNALPIVRVQPVYPRKALALGIEGYAVVSLTVNPDGTVDPRSIIILEAEPAGYFERAARDAAMKFKYKPRVVDGTAVPATGVQYKFTFALGSD